MTDTTTMTDTTDTRALQLQQALLDVGLELEAVEVVTIPDFVHHSVAHPCTAGRGIHRLSTVRASALDGVRLCPECSWGDPQLRITHGSDPSSRRITKASLGGVKRAAGQVGTVLTGTPSSIDQAHRARDLVTTGSLGAFAQALHPEVDLTARFNRRLGSDLLPWFHRQLVLIELELLEELDRQLHRSRGGSPNPVLGDALERLEAEMLDERWCLVDAGRVRFPSQSDWYDEEEAEPEPDPVLDLLKGFVLGSQHGRAVLLTDAVVRALAARDVLGEALVRELVFLPRTDMALVEAVGVLYDPDGSGACTTLTAALEVALAIDGA